MTDPYLEKLADGVWAYIQPDGSWMINNMGLIDGPDGAVSIDVTSTERRTLGYLDTVGAVANPIRRVIYTHSHPDHCNGASLLPDAEIIAHENVAEELRRTPPPAAHIFRPFVQGAVTARMPSTAYAEKLDLKVGDRSVELRHPARTSHTAGDTYVWLPAERILFAGDLIFNGGTPFVLSGSPAGWLATIDELAALEPAIVVPGHGPTGGAELLEPVARYLRFLIAAARDAHAQGHSPLEAARALDLGEFGNWLDPERIVGNLHRALAELEGRQLDFAAVWQDMYDFNGNSPLICHA
jgi:cyclase